MNVINETDHGRLESVAVAMAILDFLLVRRRHP